MNKLIWSAVAIVAAAFAVGPQIRLDAGEQKTRVKHPDFSDGPADVFFQDAFSEGLTGPRPVRNPGGGTIVPPHAASPGKPADSSGKYAWSELISSETIEDEIKAISNRIEESMKTAGFFKGRGYRQARREFSIAAMLFAIIAEYDRDVRWQKSAAEASNAISRAARNAKVGTEPVYRESRERLADLKGLIRGSKLSGSASFDGSDWSKICQREPLMQRLEQTEQDRLAVWLASRGTFESQRATIIQEAELASAMAQVLRSEGMQDAGDDEYDSYCELLRESAQEIADAAKRDDFDSARKALGQLRKSCRECHDLYRE